jgi:DNA-binding beta-propeller fold protein YncE
MSRKMQGFVVVGLAVGALVTWAQEQETPPAQTTTVIAFTHPAPVLTLVNTIDTSRWSPPSPDPAGLTFRPAYTSSAGVAVPARILLSDAEVDEMPALFTGSNLFVTTSAGILADTGSLTGTAAAPGSHEPSDIAWNPSGRNLYISDDNLDKIFLLNPGGDGRFGTADDNSIQSIYSTGSFGSADPEGIDYDVDGRSLWLADGDGSAIYHLQRGPDNAFGTIDDIITQWDSRLVGMRDPEGIDFDPATGHLFIADRLSPIVAEATTTGTLVALYDLSGSPLLDASGITLAPASSGAGTSIFVSDRGIDNDVDPTENDGRVYEFALTIVNANS